MPFYAAEGEEQDPAQWLASIGADQSNGAKVTALPTATRDEIG
jgi:hypothetical protein